MNQVPLKNDPTCNTGQFRAYERKVYRVIRSIVTGAEESVEYPEKIAMTIWDHCPASWRSTRVMQEYGRFFHRRACSNQKRTPEALYTRFLRNRPMLELITDLVCSKEAGSMVKICDLACSKGAEIYSLCWLIRGRRPDLDISCFGSDISSFAVEEAKKGTYRYDSKELERLTLDELDALFIREGDFFIVRDWIRKGISWVVEDAKNPNLLNLLGLQDLVLGNNFLIHLGRSDEEACLSNIIRLVKPGGYLCIWNVDLDIKTKVLERAGLRPISDKYMEIYEADARAKEVWPWRYWGVEPPDPRRKDWALRYSALFQKPAE